MPDGQAPVARDDARHRFLPVRHCQVVRVVVLASGLTIGAGGGY
jgi:hypothetical protein